MRRVATLACFARVKSGVAHFLAESEDECFAQVRRLFKYIPQSCEEPPASVESTDDPEREAPELATIIPDNPKEAYDIREVVTAVVDHGEFFEVQPFYAMNIVVGFAHLDGRPVGIVANQPKVMAGAPALHAAGQAAPVRPLSDPVDSRETFCGGAPARSSPATIVKPPAEVRRMDSRWSGF